jgi:hypothetical protein
MAPITQATVRLLTGGSESGYRKSSVTPHHPRLGVGHRTMTSFNRLFGDSSRSILKYAWPIGSGSSWRLLEQAIVTDQGTAKTSCEAAPRPRFSRKVTTCTMRDRLHRGTRATGSGLAWSKTHVRGWVSVSKAAIGNPEGEFVTPGSTFRVD